jgi:hypothetical protein
MAGHEMRVTFETEILRSADGLIRGVRISASNCPGLVDIWYWLDRDADELQGMRPHRVGMLERKPR